MIARESAFSILSLWIPYDGSDELRNSRLVVLADGTKVRMARSRRAAVERVLGKAL